MIIKAGEFNLNMIAALPVQARNSGNQGTKKRREYKDAVFAFDIETTYIRELDRQILYIWQFQVDEVLTIIGRTWREFIDFYNGVNALLKATEYIVVYILLSPYHLCLYLIFLQLFQPIWRMVLYQFFVRG